MLLQRLAEPDVYRSLRDMKQLEMQLNRWLANHESSSYSEFPQINVWSSEDGAVVRTEIPGVDPEKVDISLVNDTVTIRGSRHEETFEEEHSCTRKERRFGHFTRSLQLPFTVDGDGVKARFNDGILEIKLPRAEADKPRKISVSSQ